MNYLVTPDHEIRRIWLTIASENNWPQDRCPISERRSWIFSIAAMTQATGERVERIGAECGVVSPNPEGWGLDALVEKHTHDLTPRSCKVCGEQFQGKGQAERCPKPTCKYDPKPANALTSAEAGEILGVHCQKVIDFARDGKLTRYVYSKNKSSRWDREEVQQLAQEMGVGR